MLLRTNSEKTRFPYNTVVKIEEPVKENIIKHLLSGYVQGLVEI